MTISYLYGYRSIYTYYLVFALDIYPYMILARPYLALPAVCLLPPPLSTAPPLPLSYPE